MKIRLLFLFLLLLISSLSYSQQVESLHSVKFGIPSVTYSYEQALGNQFSINIEVGATWSFQSSPNSFKFHFNPIFQVEPRIYYNVKKRYDQDRFLNNTASFFSLNSGFTFPTDYQSHGFFIVPKWGFRRAMGKHFIFEAQIGGGVWIGSNSHQFNPALDIKFGYVF